MQSKTKSCPVCHGGYKQPGTTTFTVELGFGVVVVRNVPAQVCDLCGTDWLEDDVAQALENIVKKARLKHQTAKIGLWQEEVQALVA